jgi:hypothetical protein
MEPKVECVIKLRVERTVAIRCVVVERIKLKWRPSRISAIVRLCGAVRLIAMSVKLVIKLLNVDKKFFLSFFYEIFYETF